MTAAALLVFVVGAVCGWLAAVRVAARRAMEARERLERLARAREQAQR